MNWYKKNKISTKINYFSWKDFKSSSEIWTATLVWWEKSNYSIRHRTWPKFETNKKSVRTIFLNISRYSPTHPRSSGLRPSWQDSGWNPNGVCKIPDNIYPLQLFKKISLKMTETNNPLQFHQRNSFNLAKNCPSFLPKKRNQLQF